MSAGLPFGSMPSLADLDPSTLTQILAQLRGQGGPPLAMSEADTQRLERQQASPQDMAALGGSPLDRLLFDQTGMGGDTGFTGRAEPYAARAVPLPPERPSPDDLMAPQATGSVQGMNPGAVGAPTRPAPVAAQRMPAPAGMAPVDSFDPLTGQPVSGSPKPLAAAGMPQAAAQPAGGQPGFMERFAQGLNNPEVGNLLLHIGTGLLTERGFGAGVGAGLKSYQGAQTSGLANQLKQIQLAQMLQGQNATRSYLIGRGIPAQAADAAMLNPTVLTSVLAQMNKDPSNVTVGGNIYSLKPGEKPSDAALLGPADGPPSGFRAAPGGGLAPIAGGPATPEYKAAVAGAEAKAKDDATPDAPIQVRPGGVVLDPETYKPLYEAPGNKPAGFETEEKLRGDFNKQLNTFNQMHEGYGRIVAATQDRQNNPGKVSPAADMSLIFGYMKMLDPGSVVREGEYATAQNATGVPGKIANAYNKALSGEPLNDEQRRDFLDQSEKLYGQARKNAEGLADHFRGLSTQYGVVPDRVVRLPDVPQMPKIPNATPGIAWPKTQADFDALPKGTIYTDPQDGKKYRK